MSKLFYRDKATMGLDIGQTGAKVMEIDQTKDIVTGFGSIDLDPAQLQLSIDDGQDEYLSSSLKTLLQEKVVGSINTRRAILSVPTARTFSRTVTLPVSAEKTLRSAIELEAEQYIPMPLSQLNLDYQIVDRTKDQITVLMCAAPKRIIDHLVQAAQSAGIETVMIEPSITAVGRLLAKTERADLPSIIVDIGPAVTDIAAIDGGSVRVTGSVAVGGNTFTLDVARELDTSLENAHQLKVLQGLNVGTRQAKLETALKPSLNAIIAEIKKVLRYYNERLQGPKIEQLLIVGSGANVPGIGEYFTNELVIAARVANPWQALNFGSLTAPSKQIKPRYITVAGLASVRSKEIW